MKKFQYKRIAVKIGSNVLAQKDGTFDVARITALVDQITKLYKAGVEVILISSGAVALGRNTLKLNKKLDSVSSRQVFSAIGQAKLINYYDDLFSERNITCGQVLTTKESLSTRMHYLNQKNCMTAMLACGVIPIINENDTISVTELMFTDNDELSGLVATMMNAEALVILSNIDGIFNGDPKDSSSEVIREVLPERDLEQYIQEGKSSFGRGGMLTKCNIARKVANEGIPVYIANGKKDNILTNLIAGEDVICTKFVPATEVVSSMKKWIAHSEGFAKGEVHINQGAAEALIQREASSLLFVGITEIKGVFEKDDIVRIFDHNGKEIGVGKSQYDSEKALTLIGKKGIRPLIHYDYLHLEQY